MALVNIDNIKEDYLKHEESYLSAFGFKTRETKGRARKEQNECPIRTEFQRDRDRIVHSKAFRRLKHKTQVFFSPMGDHYRTRMTHTFEVSQISRTIARALRLNEDLTEAIALGHDLGHTPFGHTGEYVLNELLPDGFRHNEQSVRVVSEIEDLNLTYETIDGILNHTGDTLPSTLEGQVVRITDRIAYLNHDIDDALRAGIIDFEFIPEDCIKFFGEKHSERIDNMVQNVIINSYEKDKIQISNDCEHYMKVLRTWMFDNVYTNSPAKLEEDKTKKIIVELFSYYENILKSMAEDEVNEADLKRTVGDYIAGMTDRYAIKKYKNLMIPTPMVQSDRDDFLYNLARKNNVI